MDGIDTFGIVLPITNSPTLDQFCNTLSSNVILVHYNHPDICTVQAHSQKILLGDSFEGNMDLFPTAAIWPTTVQGAVDELIFYAVYIAHIHKACKPID